jgi:small subunit ribosomal protein S20
MANPAQENEKKGPTKRPTAQKRHRQDEKRRIANKSARSCIRTKIRAFREGAQAFNVAERATSLNELNSLLDKAAKKKLVTPNKASRLKSRLAAHLRSASTGS